jgi:hypothetical protein
MTADPVSDGETAPRKKFILTIEVDGFNADDLDEYAGYIAEPDPPDADDRLFVVTEEWIRPDVTITVCTLPGDKCMNSDFELVAFSGRIIGAEIRDRDWISEGP